MKKSLLAILIVFICLIAYGQEPTEEEISYVVSGFFKEYFSNDASISSIVPLPGTDGAILLVTVSPDGWLPGFR
ncbi:MAG: hypothetical protein R2744_07440 [Bacteroidales bacterium]